MTKEGNKRRGKGARGLVSLILSLLLLLQGFVGSTPVYADPGSKVFTFDIANGLESFSDPTHAQWTEGGYTLDFSVTGSSTQMLGSYEFDDRESWTVLNEVEKGPIVLTVSIPGKVFDLKSFDLWNELSDEDAEYTISTNKGGSDSGGIALDNGAPTLKQLNFSGADFTGISSFTLTYTGMEYAIGYSIDNLDLHNITDLTTDPLSNDAGLSSVLGQIITAGGEAGTSGEPKTAAITVTNTTTTVAAINIVKHDAGAIVTFYGTDSTFATEATGSVNLTAGATTDIYIKVEAADETTLYYKVTITRDAAAQTPQPPTVTGGAEYIDVTNVEAGAELKLYIVGGQLASTTYRDMGNGTYRFEDVLPHSSWYYVTKSVGGQESLSSFVNPTFRIPVATKGVESVDVTNVSSNATIRLYKVVEGTDPDILISENPTSVGNGTYRFENITPDSAGFYVTQYANTIESANCPFFGVDLRTPSISGGNGQITVSNIFPGANITLYDPNGVIQTANNVTTATHQFSNVVPGNGYYVQQTINGVISLPSNSATTYSSGPQFVGGTPTIAVRQYPNPTDLRDQLYVSDLDVGQTLTWTVVSGPSHGTLDGFPATASTNGSGGIYGTVGSTDTRIPTAVTYTPAQDYVGDDSFTIQVSDGTATATRTIQVGVNHTSGTSVNAMNSAELTEAINNPAVAIIILTSNTTYQIGGAEINRPLTIRGNGATIEVLSGVGQSFDDQTIYHLGMPDKDGNRRYRGNIFWYVKDGGSLTVENLTLRNTAITENAQGLTGIFAAILLNDDADLDVSGVVFDNFWFKNSKLAEQNNLLAAQGLGGYTTYSDLSYGVYGDYNCTGNITIDHSIFSSSNAFRDAVHIYNANNVTLDYNTFTGTNYSDRLRESDAFEYGMYLYGGNYTVTHNTVRYYDSYKIPGYSSAGIALLPYNDTDATLEDNTIQGNTVGLEIVGGWEALTPAPNVTINQIELDTEDNGFKIGEALKASNTISGSTGADIFIKLDQDDADEAFVYYAPFLSISGTNTTEPTLNFAQTAGAIELVSSAITIEVEKSEDNGLSWTTASVEGTLDNSSTSAVVNLEANKTYTLRVKMTHNNGQTPNAVITGYSNAVTFTTASGISLITAPEFTFTAATEGYGPQPVYSVTVMNTGAEGTGALTITLSGENPGSFTLDQTSISDIAAGSNTNFTVRPNTGLAIGTYTATVTVSGSTVTAQSFNVSFTVSPAGATYTATIYHDIDNLAADVMGSVELKQGTTTITASKSETGIGIYTASLPNGYYSIYVNGVDTGRMLNISAGNSTATLRYYTVSFSATPSGTATGSSINATAGGTAISNGAVVLAGMSVAITASGTGAGSYTYAWSGGGTNGQTTGTLNIPFLNSTVNATCTVTGSGSPPADPDYRINNESYNWSGSDQTIVLAGNSDTLTIFKAPTAVVKIDVQSDDGSNVTIDGNSIPCINTYVVVSNDITLNLHNLDITAPAGSSEWRENTGLLLKKTDTEADTMTIDVSGICRIKGNDSGPGIASEQDQHLLITGTGTLYATGGDSAALYGSDGINVISAIPFVTASGAKLTIDGGVTVNATGGNNTAGVGGRGILIGWGNIAIVNGTVNAIGGAGLVTNASGGNGIEASFPSTDHSKGGKITITGGILTASGGNSANNYGGVGVYAFTGLEISGGMVTAAGGNSNAGPGGAAIYAREGNMIISGGTVIATGGGSDAGSGNTAVNVYDGNLEISGGTVTVTGGSGHVNGSHAVYAHFGTVTIGNGANVTASGGNGSTGLGGVGVRANGNSSGNTVTIANSAGNVYIRGGEGVSEQRASIMGKYVYIGTGNIGPVVMEGTNPPRFIKNMFEGDDVYLVKVTTNPAAAVEIRCEVSGGEAADYTYRAVAASDGTASLWLPEGTRILSAAGYIDANVNVVSNDTQNSGTLNSTAGMMNVGSVKVASFVASQTPIPATLEITMSDIGLDADAFAISNDTTPTAVVTVNSATYANGKYTLSVSGMTYYDSYTLTITKEGYDTYTNSTFYGALAAGKDLDLVNEPNMFPTFSRALTNPGIVTISNSTYAKDARLYSGPVYTAIDTNNGHPDNGNQARFIGIFVNAPEGAKAVKTLRLDGQMLKVAEDSLIDSNPNYQETVASGKAANHNDYWKTIAFVPLYSQIASARQSDNSRILEDPADRFRIIEWYDNEECTGEPIKVTRLMVKVEYIGTPASNDAGIATIAGEVITAGTEAGTKEAPKTASVNVAHAKSSIGLADIGAAANATVKLYTDAEFSQEITGSSTLALTSGGATTAYIKVTAQDGITVQCYAVTINREASSRNDNDDDSSPSTSNPTPTQPTTPANSAAIPVNVTDNHANSTTKTINAQITNDSNGTKTLSFKSQKAILEKKPDGTRTEFGNLDKVGFTPGQGTASSISLSADGTIQVKNLANGTESQFKVTFDLGNGQKIAIGRIEVKVDKDGAISLTSTLIDPYGIILDSATNQPITGVDVKLYYADTARNRAGGKTPDTLVALPTLTGFEPNDNANPQVSNSYGAYAYMVFPQSDYYLLATKAGYERYKSPIITVEQDIVKWDFKMHQSLSGVQRLFGSNRVETAIAIAQANYPGKVANVVLATANNYPDALAGSVLAYKLNAPLLLVGSTAQDQESLLNYLKEHVETAGTITILGGTGAVPAAVEETIQAHGYSQIIRLGGANRYETALKIAEELKVEQGRPVILAYGGNYPDALSVSSAAAAIQSPILLVEKNGISEGVKNKLAQIKPIKVYIIGLEGVISQQVEDEVAQLTSLKQENIIRIGGPDRYQTSLAVAKYFNLSGKNIGIATGNNFPDALAGSVYAANHNAPILLLNDTIPNDVMDYLKSREMTGATIFGGEAVINAEIEQKLRELIK